VYIIC